MTLKKILLASILATSLTACASTSTNSTTTATKTETSTKSTTKADKKTATETFSASLTASHDAAEAALKLHGFTIKSSDANVIKGKRPNKIGLAVGSGGEKITVTLDAINDGSTKVSVKTKKTFVGIVGQKNWNAPVMDAIRESLK